MGKKREAELKLKETFPEVVLNKKTFSQLVEYYQDSELTQLKDPYHRIQHLKWWMNYFGEKQLRSIRPDDIYKAEMPVS